VKFVNQNLIQNYHILNNNIFNLPEYKTVLTTANKKGNPLQARSKENHQNISSFPDIHIMNKKERDHSSYVDDFKNHFNKDYVNSKVDDYNRAVNLKQKIRSLNEENPFKHNFYLNENTCNNNNLIRDEIRKENSKSNNNMNERDFNNFRKQKSQPKNVIDLNKSSNYNISNPIQLDFMVNNNIIPNSNISNVNNLKVEQVNNHNHNNNTINHHENNNNNIEMLNKSSINYDMIQNNRENLLQNETKIELPQNLIEQLNKSNSGNGRRAVSSLGIKSKTNGIFKNEEYCFDKGVRHIKDNLLKKSNDSRSN